MIPDIFDLHADICKTLASPARLRIIAALEKGELTVGQLVAAIGRPKANVSQHLAIMRQKGILEARRQGNNVYYRLANEKVTRACELMREVLLEQLTRGDKIAAETRAATG